MSQELKFDVNERSQNQDAYPYYGTPGNDLPRFDYHVKLPTRVEPSPRLIANIGLYQFPDGLRPLLNSPKIMPPNLTRCRPDKFSDNFFVERRLNGFNPGKFKRVEKQEWQYVIRYDCSKYKVEIGGILPAIIEARFTLQAQCLHLHSIYYKLNNQEFIKFPLDAEWEWAKTLFRSAEFVFQEAQSHLARTHLNIEQYAIAYYRNIVNNPIKLLLEPHLEGLINVNKLGVSTIFGDSGVIPEASALNATQVDSLLFEEVSRLSYHTWHPRNQMLKDFVSNNYYDRAALTVWQIIEQYVVDFFNKNDLGIKAAWQEVKGMSEDLVKHSILKPELGSLAIGDLNKSGINDLKKLCVYVIYHSTFFHSWVNYKQYEDGGEPDYASLGLWDSTVDKAEVIKRHINQTVIAWTLSNVRYNPIMEEGSDLLKDLLWQHRDKIEPGLPLDLMMMSIHI